MHDLDALRDARDGDIVQHIYDAVEKNRDVLDSDSYGTLMNALLIQHERLKPQPPPAREEPVPYVVRVMGRVSLSSERERRQRIIEALQLKHEVEQDMDTYGESSILTLVYKNVLETIQRLERLPITPPTPVIEYHPVIL